MDVLWRCLSNSNNSQAIRWLVITKNLWTVVFDEKHHSCLRTGEKNICTSRFHARQWNQSFPQTGHTLSLQTGKPKEGSRLLITSTVWSSKTWRGRGSSDPRKSGVMQNKDYSPTVPGCFRSSGPGELLKGMRHEVQGWGRTSHAPPGLHPFHGYRAGESNGMGGAGQWEAARGNKWGNGDPKWKASPWDPYASRKHGHPLQLHGRASVAC